MNIKSPHLKFNVNVFRGGHRADQGGFSPFLGTPCTPAGCVNWTRDPHFIRDTRGVRVCAGRGRAGRGGAGLRGGVGLPLATKTKNEIEYLWI